MAGYSLDNLSLLLLLHLHLDYSALDEWLCDVDMIIIKKRGDYGERESFLSGMIIFKLISH